MASKANSRTRARQAARKRNQPGLSGSTLQAPAQLAEPDSKSEACLGEDIPRGRPVRPTRGLEE